MTGAMIVVAIGILLIIADWHMATKPDETDKIKRRKPLNPVQRKMLLDMVVWTVVVAAAVWAATKYFS
jgi:hypothetical protein